METKELLPCPFCGGKGETHLNGLNLWKPYCTNCTVILSGESVGFDSKKDAINAWNKRYKKDD